MYKPITRDENAVIILMLLFGALCGLSEKTHFPGRVVIAVFMILSGYLLFNRQVKMVVSRSSKRKTYYPVTAVITETKEQSLDYGVAKGKYPFFVIEYQVEDGKMCTKELHNFFSVRAKKAGQKIGVLVNRDNSDDIIVKSSDLFFFVLLCVLGVIIELVLTVMLVNIN